MVYLFLPIYFFILIWDPLSLQDDRATIEIVSTLMFLHFVLVCMGLIQSGITIFSFNVFVI